MAKVGVGLISGLEKWEQNPEIKKLDKKSTASKCLADFFLRCLLNYIIVTGFENCRLHL